MIKSFRHKELERFFLEGKKSGIQAQHADKLSRQLAALNHATGPDDMNLPGWRLHPLKGRLAGHWSIIRTTIEEAIPMTTQHNPPHPGAILREDILPALDLSVTEAARQLGGSRVTLSRLINEQSGLSPEMALRIEAWLGEESGGRAEMWAGMQLDYDMWKARQRRRRQAA